MSPTKRPSAVGLRKAVAAPAAGKRVSEMNDAEIQALAAPRRPRPERPVRFTVDLDRDRHAYLKQYAAQIEAKGSEIIRELLDEMRSNQDLQARVRARIWQKQAR